MKSQYFSGVTFPDVSQQEREAVANRLYFEWKEKYFTVNPYISDQAFIHWYEDTGVAVSEGHGYGMLLLALMGDKDLNGKTDFDKMVRFFLAHPSEVDKNFMAWQQDDNGSAIVDIGGVDSATDGDLDIAYALLLADNNWGSEGEFHYKEMAIKIINATMETIVCQDKWVLNLGDWVVNPGHDRLSTRPSDFMLQHFRTFKAVTGDVRWDKLHENIIKAINDLHAVVPKTGMLPNFAKLNAQGNFEPKENMYSWDACRIPWRTAMDFIMHGKEAALPMIKTVNNFISELTEGNPHNVRAGYDIIEGTPQAPWNSPAFTSPFMIAAMADPTKKDWLNALWKFNAERVTADGRYYDNSIRAICMLTAAGCWWCPERK